MTLPPEENTPSAWCDANNWFKDEFFTKKSKNIPINKLTDIIISDMYYTISSGNITFDTSINYGSLTNPISNNITFNSGINYGKFFYGYFYDSINSGSISTGIFSSSKNYKQLLYATFTTTCDNYGEIVEGATFDNYCNNMGNIGSSGASFNNYCNNYGNIKGSGNFNQYCNNIGIIDKDAMFNVYCNNSGDIKGNAIFTDHSNNTAATIQKDATFNKNCRNYYGYIGGVGRFNETINKGNIGKSGIFYKSKQYGNILGGAIFDNYSDFIIGTINEKAIFSTYSNNNGIINGTGLFYNNSTNIGLAMGNFGFLDQSINGNGTDNVGCVIGNTTFENSTNAGAISGNALFIRPPISSDLSYDCGWVFGGSIGSEPCNGVALEEYEAAAMIEYYRSQYYINYITEWWEVAALMDL